MPPMETLDRPLAHDFGPARGEAVVLHPSDWASNSHLWRGVVEGADVGADVTVLFFTTEEIGEGPRLHVHPYDEVFIVRWGEHSSRSANKRSSPKPVTSCLAQRMSRTSFTTSDPACLKRRTSISPSNGYRQICRTQRSRTNSSHNHRLSNRKSKHQDKSNAKNQIN